MEEDDKSKPQETNLSVFGSMAEGDDLTLGCDRQDVGDPLSEEDALPIIQKAGKEPTDPKGLIASGCACHYI